jgi:hypothetical protein
MLHSKTLPLEDAVTVSIVSHGHADLIMPLLKSLDLHCHALISKVVVTVNLEEEDFQWEDLDLRFPIKLLVNSSPKGFGKNHNHAFRDCDSGWFLVLNPDIEFDSDVLKSLLAHAEPQAGLLAPSVWEPHKQTPTAERGVITPWEVFGGRLWGRKSPPAPVWFPGMFMLFRAKAFAQVKGFDERFHMYCEDFDICARLRDSQWALQRDRSTNVRHAAQRESHVRPRYFLWHLHSLARLWLSKPFWRYFWLERSRPR